MRTCRITALLVVAATVTPCLLLLVLGSRRPSQLMVRESYGAHNGRDNADAEPTGERRVWLYSLVGTDFPGEQEVGDTSCLHLAAAMTATMYAAIHAP